MIYSIAEWWYTALTYSFPNFQPVHCSVSSSVAFWPTYGFLRKQVRWSGIHLLKNFPQFAMIHTVKGFSLVNEAEVDVFLQLSCFSVIQWDVGNLISGSPAFYKPCLYIWKFCYSVLSHGILSTTLWGHLQYGAGLRDVSDSSAVTQGDHPTPQPDWEPCMVWVHWPLWPSSRPTPACCIGLNAL